MLKLRLQFFVVMLVIFSLLTTSLYVFIKLSFKQDFWRYIEQKETRFAHPLIKDLVKNYHQEKNWKWIDNWEDYVVAKLESETREFRRANPQNFTDQRPPTPNEQDGERMPPHPDFKDDNSHEPAHHVFREWRRMPPMSALRFIFLLDEDRHLIAGKSQNLDEAFLIPLNDENKTIGFLGIPFNPAVRDLQEVAMNLLNLAAISTTLAKL